MVTVFLDKECNLMTIIRRNKELMQNNNFLCQLKKALKENGKLKKEVFVQKNATYHRIVKPVDVLKNLGFVYIKQL